MAKRALLSVAISSLHGADRLPPFEQLQSRRYASLDRDGIAKELRLAIAMQLLAEISNLGPIRFFSSHPTPGYAFSDRTGRRVDFLGADKSSGHAIWRQTSQCIDDAGLTS